MRRKHENLLYEHGKPHTGWSSYERRTSTKILDKKTESPHLGVYTGVNCSNTVRTRRARTRGEVWRRVTEKNDLEGEGSVRD